MTVSEVSYPPYDFKLSAKNSEPTYKISLKKHAAEPFVRLDRYGRGGGARAKYHKVEEFYIDSQKRIFAGFEAEKEGGKFYEYVIIGQLQVIPPRKGTGIGGLV